MKTILLFAGLPYTGKTTLIRHLAARRPGAVIHADEVFNRSVPAAQRSLERWLQEGPTLVRGITDRIQADPADTCYVEVGIMRRGDRNVILSWAHLQNHRILPILLVCDDEEETTRRYRARNDAPEDDATIRIALGELYQRIRAAFEVPAPAEGYLRVDTTRHLDECAERIAAKEARQGG